MVWDCGFLLLTSSDDEFSVSGCETVFVTSGFRVLSSGISVRGVALGHKTTAYKTVFCARLSCSEFPGLALGALHGIMKHKTPDCKLPCYHI